MAGILAFFGSSIPSIKKFTEALKLQSNEYPVNIDITEFNGGILGLIKSNNLNLENPTKLIKNINGYTFLFDGEIYNSNEFSKELDNNSMSFQSKTDGELLMQAINCWGPRKAFNKASGKWGLVAVKRSTGEIIISRDKLGIKPLWIARKSNYLVISSEIKSITSLIPEFKEINTEVVREYLIQGSQDYSNQTFFKNINAFPKATYVISTKEFEFSSNNYWTPSKQKNSIPIIDDLYFLFEQAVKSNINNDSKMGLTLSGGVDSTAIASLLKDSSETKFYSIVPPQSRNESKAIDLTVKLWGLNHQYVDCEEVENTETIDYIIDKLDQPFKAAQTIYQYAIRKQASLDGVKYFLSGSGADEVFGGYKNCIVPYLCRFFRNGEAIKLIKNAKGLEEFSGKSFIELLMNTSKQVLKPNYKQKSPTGRQELGGDLSNYIKFRYVNKPLDLRTHLLNRLLISSMPFAIRVEDGITRSFAMESRFPFLNHFLIDYAFSHDESYCFQNGKNKALLRDALDKLLPDHVRNLSTKFQRPGNTKRLIFSVISNDAADTFADDNYLLKKGATDRFLQDKKKGLNFQFWMRAYLACRWKILKS